MLVTAKRTFRTLREVAAEYAEDEMQVEADLASFTMESLCLLNAVERSGRTAQMVGATVPSDPLALDSPLYSEEFWNACAGHRRIPLEPCWR